MYHFISASDFLNDVHEDKFLEHANVFGNHYGTSKAAVEVLLEKGVDLAFRVNLAKPSVLQESRPVYGGGTVDYKLVSIPFYLIGQIRRLINEAVA